jgi:DNA-binding LytR/AlgR family response regulator
VVGPAGSVEDALRLIDAGERIDAAVLDINLRGERVYPVAEALGEKAVPFVFATGYDAWAIPPAYAEAPRCEKPVDVAVLARLLAGGMPAR